MARDGLRTRMASQEYPTPNGRPVANVAPITRFATAYHLRPRAGRRTQAGHPI